MPLTSAAAEDTIRSERYGWPLPYHYYQNRAMRPDCRVHALLSEAPLMPPVRRQPPHWRH
jgi:hypothetical protein